LESVAADVVSDRTNHNQALWFAVIDEVAQIPVFIEEIMAGVAGLERAQFIKIP